MAEDDQGGSTRYASIGAWSVRVQRVPWPMRMLLIALAVAFAFVVLVIAIPIAIVLLVLMLVRRLWSRLRERVGGVRRDGRRNVRVVERS